MANAPRKGKVPAGPGQPLKDAELIEVVEAKEPWSEYVLADGSLLKSKLVVTEIWKIENEYDADGNPAYVCKVNNITNILAPDKLKRKTQ